MADDSACIPAEEGIGVGIGSLRHVEEYPAVGGSDHQAPG